jgi:hypothetical protein
LQICDIHGKQIQIETFQNATLESFDMGALPKGIYMVSGNIDGKKMAAKIVLQ